MNLNSMNDLNFDYLDFSEDFPLGKRTEKLRHKFNTLKTLNSGDECFLKGSNEKCMIKKKISKDRNLYFTIKTKNDERLVKASEIRKERRKSDIFLEPANKLKRELSKRISNAQLFVRSKLTSSFVDLQSNLACCDTSIRLSDWRYVCIDSNLSQFSFTDKFEDYSVKELVEIDDRVEFFGRIAFFITLGNEYLIGLTLSDDTIEMLKETFGNETFADIFFTESCLKKPFIGILIQPVYIEKFAHDLTMSKPPFLSRESFMILESLKFDELVAEDFVKFHFGTEIKYGKIRRTLLINDKRCVEISLTNVGYTQAGSKYLREEDVAKIVNIQSEIEFHDGVIIDNSNILCVQPFAVNDWRKNDDVYFQLRCSGEKFSGTLICTLKINDLASAIIQLETNANDASINQFKCHQELLHQNNCDDCDHAYLIPLSLLQRDKSKDLLEIFKFVLTNEDNWPDNIINEALKLRDDSILPFVITHIERVIDLELSPDLLPKLFQQNEFQTLKVLLNKSKCGNNSNVALLEQSFECLKSQNEELFALLSEKCSDRDIKLRNGETFLTNLIKSNMADDIIVKMIKSGKFDVATCNEEEESPITLATVRLMMAVIESLIKTSKIDQYQLRKARDILMKDDANLSNENGNKQLKVIKILQSAILDDICRICMDRPHKIVFDCGHLYCDVCSEKIVECSICKKVPDNKITLYK